MPVESTASNFCSRRHHVYLVLLPRSMTRGIVKRACKSLDCDFASCAQLDQALHP